MSLLYSEPGKGHLVNFLVTILVRTWNVFRWTKSISLEYFLQKYASWKNVGEMFKKKTAWV